jgi:hypothetical protein
VSKIDVIAYFRILRSGMRFALLHSDTFGMRAIPPATSVERRSDVNDCATNHKTHVACVLDVERQETSCSGGSEEHPKICKAGETFYEPTGCLHRVSRNPGAKGKTRLIAFVLHPRDAKEIAIPEHHFVGAIAQSATDGQTVRVPPALMQPIASDDVAAALADVATDEPKNGTVEIAGPELIRMDEFVRRFLVATKDTRQVSTDPQARYYGIAVNDRSLVPGDHPRLGPTRFADWLSSQPMSESGRWPADAGAV